MAPKGKARPAAPKSKPKSAVRAIAKSPVAAKSKVKAVAKKEAKSSKVSNSTSAKSAKNAKPKVKLLSTVKPGKIMAPVPKALPPMSKGKDKVTEKGSNKGAAKGKLVESKKPSAPLSKKTDKSTNWNGTATAKAGNKTASKPAKFPEKPAKSADKPASLKPASKIADNGSPKAKKLAPPKRPQIAPPPVSSTSPKIVRKIRELQSERELRKDLGRDVIVGTLSPNQPRDIVNNPTRDRLALIVRDPYWLHASWEITRRSVDRARAAMAEHWHSVRAILRLLKIDGHGITSNAETVFRDIEVHGGVRNWYIDVPDPPSTFRAQIGYLAANGRFHELAASNVVATAAPGSTDSVSEHWADIDANAEHIYAMSGGYNEECDTKDLRQMFEDRLERPMGAPALTQFGSGADAGFRRARKFHFNVDAEMIVYGSTRQDAYVTLSGEPLKVEADGTFSIRVPLPDRRQVLPIIASTRDGVDEQTIVIMVERNTKILEPLSKENEEPL
jgi:uncharacterized protein